MNEHHQLADLPEDDGITLLDILQTLAENARLLIFGPLFVGLVALGVTFLLPPKFEATTTILIPQQQSAASAALAQLGALAGMAGAAAGLKNPTDIYIGLLKSRTIADSLVERFHIMESNKLKTREDARDVLSRITRVNAGKDGLISISVIAYEPPRAAAVANAYVQELSLLTGRLAVTEAQERRQFLEKELAKAKKNLISSEVALGDAGVSERLLKFNPGAMGEGIATLKAQVAAKEVQLFSMRGYLTQNSPDFRQVQQELAALRAQLAKAAQNPPSGGNAEYINRYREFKYNEVLFEQLTRQYEMAKIDESSDGAMIQVVDVAVPPERKANLSRALVASLAALIAGFVLLQFVFVRRALRNANRSPDTAAKMAAIRAGFGRVLKPRH